MSDKLYGTFPINMDKGSPVLRSRGEWNQNDVYVYDYNFRDMVVHNPGSATEEFYVVKNRYTSVSGAGTEPPNKLYWEKSEKVQFLWAGAITSDMIDTESLTVRNLTTDIDKTKSRIEITKNTNDIRVYDQDKLRVLISPRNALNIDDVVDVKKFELIVDSSVININKPRSMCRILGPKLLEVHSMFYPDFSTKIIGNIHIPSMVLKNISLSKIKIKFNIDLDNYEKALYDFCSVGYNIKIKSNIDTNSYKHYPTNKPITCKIYINKSENGNTIDGGIYLTDVILDKTINNEYSSEIIDSIKDINIMPGNYNIILNIDPELFRVGYIYELTASYIDGSDLGLYLNYIISLIQGEYPEYDVSSHVYNNINSFNIKLNGESKGELIGINNNSFYIFKNSNYFYKLFSDTDKITKDISLFSSKEVYKSTTDTKNTLISKDSLGIHIINDGVDAKFFEKGFAYSDVGHIFFHNEEPKGIAMDALNWDISTFIGATGQTYGDAPHVYLDRPSYYEKIKVGKKLSFHAIHGNIVIMGIFIIGDGQRHEGWRQIGPGSTVEYTYCGNISFAGLTGHTWKESLVCGNFV